MKLVIVGILVTLELHFTWEMLQAPAFVHFAEISMTPPKPPAATDSTCSGACVMKSTRRSGSS